MQIIAWICLSFFVSSCDYFSEGRENKVTQAFVLDDVLIRIDCSALKLMNQKISKVKFFKNGKFVKQVSGFEIQKAKLCPKISFDEKKDKITAFVYFSLSNDVVNCSVLNATLKC